MLTEQTDSEEKDDNAMNIDSLPNKFEIVSSNKDRRDSFNYQISVLISFLITSRPD